MTEQKPWTERITQWAEDRNLIKGVTVEAQWLKLLEEIGETAEAIGKNDVEGIKDGIGDIAVVWCIIGAIEGRYYKKSHGWVTDDYDGVTGD